MLIMLAAIGLLPLTMLGVWSIHTGSQYQQREQERAMLDQARALSSAADAELDGALAVLTGLGRSTSLLDGDLLSFYDAARSMAATQPEWLAVILHDETGHMLFRTTAPYGSPPTPAADPDSLQRVLKTRRAVVGRIAHGQSGKAAIPVRVPVIAQGGRVYALTAVLRPDRMVQVIKRQRVPEGTVISIMDAGRMVVARSRDQHRTVAGAPSASLVAMMQRSGLENVGVSSTMEGDEVVTAYTTLSHYGWSVAVGRPTVLLRAAAQQRFMVYGAGIVLTLLACTALASLMSTRLVRTISGLQAGAAALGTGAPIVLEPSSIKEIQLIGAALEVAERQRTEQERQRALLLDSLNAALASNQAALRRRARRAAPRTNSWPYSGTNCAIRSVPLSPRST